MSGKKIIIYDTTLRDGMQGQGINYTLEDKVQIALAMDEFGIDYIEGGFPLSNRKEAEFFQRMRKENLKHARWLRLAPRGNRMERQPPIRRSPPCCMRKPPRSSSWEKPGKLMSSTCCRPPMRRTSQ